MKARRVTVQTLNGGAISELFDMELMSVLDDIADINKKADDTRTITICIKLKPDKSRRSASSTITVDTSLAKRTPSESFVVLSNEGGSMEAFVDDPKQPELPVEEEGMGKIINAAFGG